MKRLLKTLCKPLSFLPALCMMYLIFSFSGQAGEESSKLSLKVTKTAVIAINKVTDQGWNEAQMEQKVQQYHHYVRKAAHMTEYCILAITIATPLHVYGLRGITLILVSGIICLLFAAGDEYHQSFVAARVPSGKDVLIDSTGALMGIFLTLLFSWIARGGKKTL